jgi:hypothetical protein
MIGLLSSLGISLPNRGRIDSYEIYPIFPKPFGQVEKLLYGK